MSSQGSVFLFCLLSFPQRTEGSLARKFAEGNRECGRQQATPTACEEEYSNKKLSRETLSEFLLNVRLFSSNGFGSCMETLHAKELCRDWLRPCSFSSPLNGSSGHAKSGKVPCWQQHPQQAAKDPSSKRSRQGRAHRQAFPKKA